MTRRVFRLIKKGPGQFVALSVIVMLGVVIYIAMTSAFNNLSRSQQEFYHKTRFADYFFQVVKAPQSVVSQVRAMPGVVRAAGRIQKDLAFIKPRGGRGTVRLISCNPDDENELNMPQVINGKYFSTEAGRDIEVLVDPQFARANNLEQGGEIRVIAEGREAVFKVIGTAVSPEFIYIMKDSASLLPDPEEFGIVMIPYKQAERILNMQGEVNHVAIQLAPGAVGGEAEESIKECLRPYGNLAAYSRDKQLSHEVLKGELEQLKVTSLFMPWFFFLTAAGIQFLLLGRMIKNQRLSIGVLKALGYSSFDIIGHYVSYAIAVSLTGAFFGAIFGIWLASVFSDMYAQYFNLPEVIGALNTPAIVKSVLLSLTVGGVSGLLACLAVTGIQPAEAMRSKAPVVGRRVWLERWSWFWEKLHPGWRMSLRSLVRNRTRALVTVLGVGSTVMLMILALFINDAIDYMMSRHFLEENRYDYLIQLSAPVKENEILYWNQWQEVRQIEPVLEVPVVFTSPGSATEQNDVLYGMNPSQELIGIYSPQEQRLSIPEDGVIISERTANKLGVKVGDTVGVETRMSQGGARKNTLKVLAINQPLMGGGSYVSLAAANRLLGESRTISRVLVRVEPGQDEVFKKRFESMTAVSSIVSQADEKAGWDNMMGSAVASIAFMIMFAALLGMAIIYNSTLMNFNERQREMASMRVLGYKLGEIRGLLARETLVQSVIGIAVGLPLGRWLGELYLKSVSYDLYSMKFVIYPRTYFLAAIAAVVFVAAGFGMVMPRLKQLDLVGVLKSTD